MTKVQIARRMCCWDQGQNVSITIGPSKEYDPDETLCRPEIPDLVREGGLQDYICSGGLREGKYVKISKVGWLVLCEVKVFTRTAGEYTGQGSQFSRADSSSLRQAKIQSSFLGKQPGNKPNGQTNNVFNITPQPKKGAMLSSNNPDVLTNNFYIFQPSRPQHSGAFGLSGVCARNPVEMAAGQDLENVVPAVLALTWHIRRTAMVPTRRQPPVAMESAQVCRYAKPQRNMQV